MSHSCLCWNEGQTVSFVFVTVNHFIPFSFMKAKVSMVILILNFKCLSFYAHGDVNL